MKKICEHFQQTVSSLSGRFMHAGLLAFPTIQTADSPVHLLRAITRHGGWHYTGRTTDGIQADLCLSKDDPVAPATLHMLYMGGVQEIDYKNSNDSCSSSQELVSLSSQPFFERGWLSAVVSKSTQQHVHIRILGDQEAEFLKSRALGMKHAFADALHHVRAGRKQELIGPAQMMFG